MTTQYTKPMPVPMNPELSKPFWEATKRHELAMPRCKTCSNIFFYPREQCPVCMSDDLGWTRVSGRGRLYSFTIVHQTAHPAFQPESPHIYAVIQLNEGPRMPSNLVECELEDAEIDMPVEAVFEDVSDEYTLVKFRPSSDMPIEP